MRRRTKIIIGVVLMAAVALAVYALFSPLAVFARRISHADRAVVTMAPAPPISITITGQDLRRVVGMVSSGHRDTKDYDCSPIANVKFFKDSEMLGQMTTCVQLMWIGRRQYRDDTRLLESLVVSPLLEAKWTSEIQQTGLK
jgi:hypothetical protein